MVDIDVATTGWIVAKIFVVIIMALYLVFASVVLRQVSLMTRTLELGLETPLRLVAILHFIFAVVVFLVALLYL
jgi:uncharacterized membrane protein